MLSFKNLVESILNDQLLSEGLISSWDIQKLVVRIRAALGDKIETIEGADTLQGIIQSKTQYGKAFTVDVLLNTPMTADEKEKLERLWSLFGYTNALSHSKDSLHIRLEPNCPVDVGPLLPEETILYHIAPSKYDSKIVELGLSPRGTETTSFHPGERVYLLYIDGSPETKRHVLNVWRGVLARDKEISPEEMSIWEVRKQSKVTYFHDDTTSLLPKGVLGVFVKKNISPFQLTKFL